MEKMMPKAFHMDFDYYTRPADILRIPGHPMRLEMVQELIAKGPLNVSELQTLLRASQSTVSQQLTQLKYYKMVFYERKGNEVYYTVDDEKVIGVIKLMGL